MATRAVIHLDNLRRNIEAARKKIGPETKICMPVKADAYGHGAVPVSRFALEAGVEYLGVAGFNEGAELRNGGIKAPVLLLSQALPGELPEIIDNELTPLVSDEAFIDAAAAAADRAGKDLTVHLKVDTGLGRLGCAPEDAVNLVRRITSTKRLNLGGMATHFSASDSPLKENLDYTREQTRRFEEAVSSVRKAGIDPGIVHAANTGALSFHEEAFLNMVRPGLLLYGYSHGNGSDNAPLEVQPVMELKSVLVSIKKLKKGEAVSYGMTWTAPSDTYIGVIPTGYADGFPRGLSNNHSILIRGNAYPLTGRICMDQCMVNLGSSPEVQRWDEAVIFGPEFINAADMAAKINTIPYEILCNINKRVPREYYS